VRLLSPFGLFRCCVPSSFQCTHCLPATCAWRSTSVSVVPTCCSTRSERI
jgi:hypothetical protein